MWKVGDRCWYFDNYHRVISSAIITSIDYNILTGRDEHTGVPVAFDEYTEPFCTREALCEHYKKIFE